MGGFRSKMDRRTSRHYLAAWLVFLAAALGQQSLAYSAENLSLLDRELDNIRAGGLYFRVDLSLEVFNATDQVPTVLLNTSTPVIAPISTSGTGTTSTGSSGGFVYLSDNAQSSISSLVNVIGAGSVINVGVNVISITNSSSDTIYTTNTNYGVLGGFTSVLP